MQNIVVLGSTGSIGVQTLDAARNLGLTVVGLTANKNVKLLAEQIEAFKPTKAAIADEQDAAYLRGRFPNTEISHGEEGTLEVAEMAETVVNAISGIAGLAPTLAAIRTCKKIAIANKETLVAAGEIVMEAAKERGVAVCPIDSEHSAVFQCLAGGENPIKKIYLTASGGPFRGFTKKRLETVTKADALRHPTWNMGAKITIDSATMMNKGLEVIEARWLFNAPPENIEVVVHPQSVVHSMVEFEDGAILAQLGAPDMRLPIQYALTYPKRFKNPYKRINFLERMSLTFEPPDMETFPCLRLAYDAMRIGGEAPAVMNGANEAAVALFLEEKIAFARIYELIEQTMRSYTLKRNTLDDILAADAWARERVAEMALKY
ncbi:MAG: 1-deoxy-D-xylulose-5-phosphate reductoisomerase [Clostridiales bacterium]|jgi:1-deoxy-D-xylulose-5-phosphate reductoisomerase|nr:1-deoxy-D-xylulose-5-phosphate reductoisomerase [Clostridiales bacterium]